MVESEHLGKDVGVEAEPADSSASASSPAPPDPASYPNLNRRGKPPGSRRLSEDEESAF